MRLFPQIAMFEDFLNDRILLNEAVNLHCTAAFLAFQGTSYTHFISTAQVINRPIVSINFTN